MKLTERQQEILHLIEHAIQQTGIPPTRAEIAEKLGFRSVNAAEDHLKALARKGYIELAAGTSRGIRILLPSQPQELETNTAQIHIPLVGRVAAGMPILATEHIETHLTVNTDTFSQLPDYLLKVSGMSMKNIGILDGDLLAVKKKSSARTGEIIVARIEDEVTVKRLVIQKKHIELHPENEEFSPIIVTENQDFNIEGLAVGLIRSQLK